MQLRGPAGDPLSLIRLTVNIATKLAASIKMAVRGDRRYYISSVHMDYLSGE